MLGWPPVIWTEAAEVAAAFVDDNMSKVAAFDDEPTFYDCETHVPAAPPGHIAMQSLEIMALVGKATIADLGDGRYAIVLLNMHRGAIKHDPLLAQDRSELQLTADAAHQRRMGAYLAYILANGYPNDRASFEEMYEAGEAAVPDAMHAELKRLRALAAGREAVIHSLRGRTAVASGAVMGERVGRGTQEGRDRYESRRNDNPATQFSNVMPVDEALQALIHEESYTPLDVVLVTCASCGASVPGARSYGKFRVQHACATRLPSTTATSTKAVYTRKDLSEIKLNWGWQAMDSPCFSELFDKLELIELIAKEVLTLEEGRSILAAWGWSALLPAGWEQVQLPQTVVALSSSEEWAFANAIGVVLTTVSGRPDLERQRISLDETYLRPFLTKATESSTLYRCSRGDCFWVRPFKPTSHDCISAAGENYPPEFTKGGKAEDKPKGNRHSQSMVPFGTWSFHDLPKAVKERAWASFISASNPLGVDAQLFQPVRNGPSSLCPW